MPSGDAVTLSGGEKQCVTIVVQVRPWYEPQYIIPLAGMILGNSMTSAALAGERLLQ
jgi:ABC-type iron transport system FetAB permease component